MAVLGDLPEPVGRSRHDRLVHLLGQAREAEDQLIGDDGTTPTTIVRVARLPGGQMLVPEAVQTLSLFLAVDQVLLGIIDEDPDTRTQGESRLSPDQDGQVATTPLRLGIALKLGGLLHQSFHNPEDRTVLQSTHY